MLGLSFASVFGFMFGHYCLMVYIDKISSTDKTLRFGKKVYRIEREQ